MNTDPGRARVKEGVDEKADPVPGSVLARFVAAANAGNCELCPGRRIEDGRGGWIWYFLGERGGEWDIMIDPREVWEMAKRAAPYKLAPFRTDGCTLVPDFNFRIRGIEHDFAYWQGGTADARRRADRGFRHGIMEDVPRYSFRVWHWKLTADFWLLWCAIAWLYWIGVRVGGVPWLPTPWRWGYGRRPRAWWYDRG